MSHMTENQRMQFARPELSAAGPGGKPRSTRARVIFTVLGLLVLAALGYAAAEALDGWAMFVVLAGIIVTAIGGAIAVLHGRKEHTLV